MTAQQAPARPASVKHAMQALWLLVAVGAVATALTWILEDQLIESWAEGNRTAREVLATGGLDAVKDGPVAVPAFVVVAIVMFLVIAGLLWILGVFLAAGHEWARISLAVLLVLCAIAVVAALNTGLPTVFAVFAVAFLLVELVLAWFLVHRDTTAFLHSPAPEAADHSG